jgi:hypothetical protein
MVHRTFVLNKLRHFLLGSQCRVGGSGWWLFGCAQGKRVASGWDLPRSVPPDPGETARARGCGCWGFPSPADRLRIANNFPSQITLARRITVASGCCVKNRTYARILGTLTERRWPGISSSAPSVTQSIPRPTRFMRASLTREEAMAANPGIAAHTTMAGRIFLGFTVVSPESAAGLGVTNH